MTAYNDRLTHNVPLQDRCFAYAKPAAPGSEWQAWKYFKRRCQRRANQCRDGVPVCYQHAAAKEVEYVDWRLCRTLQVSFELITFAQNLKSESWCRNDKRGGVGVSRRANRFCGVFRHRPFPLVA